MINLIEPVEVDYKEGKFVPVYYGLRFSVARKGSKFPINHSKVDSEIDTSFIVSTLEEAQREAWLRNNP